MVSQQRKIIKEQNNIIIDLKDYLKEKIEREEEEASGEIANIVHTVTKGIINKDIDISAFHPIFQELIRIQTEKPNGTRYHPINNISKSHTGEKNAREIMFNKKEISWKHIKGVYEYTNKHATAKATKLTKRHIWLTSWSKMRVDLAEHTLSKRS
ncbi:uncharacterized protein OCT59_008205 [Rhizophagus irregularis]|uniref:uncharacterized protein n=1 Tax=Rhizophagus irregularis TaxID=588596 RepID=UPI00331D4B9D|nr:hypothetical protein OCT59_008205 [Rhizophagus irregularis]